MPTQLSHQDGPGSPLVACSLSPFHSTCRPFKPTCSKSRLLPSCCSHQLATPVPFCSLCLCSCCMPLPVPFGSFLFASPSPCVGGFLLCAHSLTSLWYGSLSVAPCVRLFTSTVLLCGEASNTTYFVLQSVFAFLWEGGIEVQKQVSFPSCFFHPVFFLISISHVASRRQVAPLLRG